MYNNNMFDSLRLSQGGGLNFSEKVSYNDDAVTLVIGIGGAGIDALRMFKKNVFEHIRPDNYEHMENAVPRYDRIKLLAIDADVNNIGNNNPALDLSEEFFSFERREPIGIIPRWLNWLNCDAFFGYYGNGYCACGTRQLGRYLLFGKAEKLYVRIKNMISESASELKQMQKFVLNVYIITSVGGGIGSGCFIDATYVVRQAISDLSLNCIATINGMIVLPDVTLSHPNMPKGGSAEYTIKANGYAALKELNYLMDIPSNGDKFEAEYSETFKVCFNERPFDNCMLFSSKTTDGVLISYNCVIDTISEFMLNTVVRTRINGMHSICSLSDLCGWCYACRVNMCGRIPNRVTCVNWFSVLGTSCAVMPYKEIGTCLAVGLFDSIKYIQKIRPNKSDVEKFCQNIGFNFNNLDVKVKANTRGLVLDANRFDTKVLKGAAVGTISGPLAEYCEKWKDDYEGKVVANIATLGRALDDYEVNNNPESIIDKIFRELISIVNNSDLGPYFAAYIINDGQNDSIVSVIAEIRKEIENRRNHAYEQIAWRNECVEKAQNEFCSTWDPFGKKKKYYVLMVEQFYKNMADVITYNALLDLIDKIKMQVTAIECDYFKKLTGITDKLIKTFEDNKEYFNTFGMRNKMDNHWSIVDINDIRENLDNAVDKMLKIDEDGSATASYFVEKFASLMLNNSDKWVDGSEIEIADLISAFIRAEFRDEMSKSMKQYLQEKYGTTGNNLINDISDKIIKDGLVAKGKPLFNNNHFWFNINDINTHIEHAFLSVPNNEVDFLSAAELFQKNTAHRLLTANSVMTDRLFISRVFDCIPLYACADLKDWENAYYKNAAPGRHLYEGEDKNWRNLPSPFPASFDLTVYHKYDTERVNEAKKVYEEALKYGVIDDNLCNADNLMIDELYRRPIWFNEIKSAIQKKKTEGGLI